MRYVIIGQIGFMAKCARNLGLVKNNLKLVCNIFGL